MLILKKRVLPLVLVTLSILASCSREAPISAPGTSNSVSGKVVKIIDGDTIDILDAQNAQHRLRLKGIDAPERTQAFYEVSRKNLATLVLEKQVAAHYEKVDQWGRLVSTVSVDGEDVCLEQIRAGLAWHFKRYEDEQTPADRDSYGTAEQKAHEQRRGLWKDSNPTPPWEYRRNKTGSFDEIDSGAVPLLHHSRSAPESAKHDLTRKRLSAEGVSSNPRPNSSRDNSELGYIRGNKRSKIYHWPGCPNYDDISPHNRVPFESRDEAESAGYRAAGNCR